MGHNLYFFHQDKLYGSKKAVIERHRHRYEVNPELVDSLEMEGLQFVGRDESGNRMEIMELENHPFYIGVQYHPEYVTRPLKPSPPFLGLILASSGLLTEFLDGKGTNNEKINHFLATCKDSGSIAQNLKEKSLVRSLSPSKEFHTLHPFKPAVVHTIESGISSDVPE